MYTPQPDHEEQLVSQDIEQAESAALLEGEQPVTPQAGRVIRNGLIAAVVLGVVALAGMHLSGSKVLHSSLGGVQEKTGIYGYASAPAPAVSTAPAVAPAFAPAVAPAVAPVAAPAPAPSIYSQAASQSLSASGIDATSIASVNELTGGKAAPAAAGPVSAAAPNEDMSDGNTCEDDEELYAKLCYKQCTLLTNGEFPDRVSAFGCSKSESITDILTGESIPSLIPCHGFAISGDEAGNGCPHDEGSCRVDEEISLGKCYKQCKLITDGEYPYRTTAMSCCKEPSVAQCFTPSTVKMSSDFDVGGGSNSRESRPHNPEVQYTEATGVPSAAPSAPAPPAAA